MKYIIETWSIKEGSKIYYSDVQETLPLALADVINKIKFDKDFISGLRFTGELTEIKDDNLDECDFVGAILRELRSGDKSSVENEICEMELKELNSMLAKWIREYLQERGVELSPFLKNRHGAIGLIKAEGHTIVMIDDKYWGQV